MKKFLILLFILPLFTFAQDEQMDTTANRIVVSEDVNECVQKIHDNPDAIKLLITIMAGDKQKMQRMRDELMKDPEIRQIIRDMRNQMHDGRMENNKMHDRDSEMNETESDTSGMR